MVREPQTNPLSDQCFRHGLLGLARIASEHRSELGALATNSVIFCETL